MKSFLKDILCVCVCVRDTRVESRYPENIPCFPFQVLLRERSVSYYFYTVFSTVLLDTPHRKKHTRIL